MFSIDRGNILQKDKMNVFELMKILIVLVSISVVALEIRKMAKLGFHWLTASVAVIGFYWAMYYIYSLLRSTFGWSFPEHQIFARSGILLSMVVFLAKAIRSNRSI